MGRFPGGLLQAFNQDYLGSAQNPPLIYLPSELGPFPLWTSSLFRVVFFVVGGRCWAGLKEDFIGGLYILGWFLSFLAFGLCLLGVWAVWLLARGFLVSWLLAFWLFGFSAFGFTFCGLCGFGFPHPQHHQKHPSITAFLLLFIFGWWLLTSHVFVDGGGCAPPTPLLLCSVRTPMNPTPTPNSRFWPKITLNQP